MKFFPLFSLFNPKRSLKKGMVGFLADCNLYGNNLGDYFFLPISFAFDIVAEEKNSSGFIMVEAGTGE